MGRPISQSPGEVRGLDERARYMAGVAEEALADVGVGAKEGFPPLHPAGAAGRRARHRAVELPFLTAVNAVVPAILCRQRGDPQAFAADAARRGALRRGLSRGRRSGRGASSSCIRRDEDTDKLDRDATASTSSPSPARCAAATRSSGDAAGRFIARRPGARRQGPGATCAPTRTSITPSRTSSTARSSTPASPAAASSASTSHAGVYDRVRRRLRRRSRSSTSWAIRSIPTTTLGPMVRAERRRVRARADRGSGGAGRAHARRPEELRGRRPGHAVPRAAGAGRRRPFDAGDDAKRRSGPSSAS